MLSPFLFGLTATEQMKGAKVSVNAVRIDPHQWEGVPTKEPMVPLKDRKKPSADQRKIRRRMKNGEYKRTDVGVKRAVLDSWASKEGVGMSYEENSPVEGLQVNEERRGLLARLAASNNFGERMQLVADLEKLDAQIKSSMQRDRDLDWANTQIQPRKEALRVHDMHSTESDWLDSVTASSTHSSHEIYAEGAMWYDSLDRDVRADAEEFLIQAQGHARRVASVLENSDAAEAEFMDYVAFLNREVLAASGLDQIGQEYDAKDEYAPTQLPTEVFDNFAPEVNETATTQPRGSDQSPNMLPGGESGGEQGRPSRHDTSDIKLNDAPHDNYPHTKTSSEDDSLDFSRIHLPSVSAADSKGTSWWKNFRDRMKSRPKGKHRMEKGDSATKSAPSETKPQAPSQPSRKAPEPQENRSPGKHRKAEDQPSRGQHAGEQSYKPKHRKGTEPPKPGKRRKEDSGGGGGKPQTINHSTPDRKPSGGGGKKADPLNDPNHKVKNTSTPTHDKVRKDKATDDHIRRELDRRQKGESNTVREIKNPGDRKNMTQKTHKPSFQAPGEKKTSLFSFADLNPTEAASGLDQIQQTVNVHDEQDARPMPDEVAFPMREDWKETSTEDLNILTNERKAMLEMAQKLAAQAEDLIKQADMWGNSDTPRPTPGPHVENSPHTTPNEGKDKSYESGYDQGARDKMVNDAPTFSDASSGAPEYVRGYSKGYSEEEGPTRPKNVPSSLGGDNDQALNSDRIERKRELPLSMGGFKASASFVDHAALDSSDFRKGYAYARKWTPNVPLVSIGSREFEAGVYAGMTDNPDHQGVFVTSNLDHEQLYPRVEAHRDFTAQLWSDDDQITVKGSYVQAATTTDRDFNSPTVSPDPWGATPQQGPGTPPPHEGLEDPARPGGPAPYNGVEPFGQPVVSNPVVGPTKEEANPRFAMFAQNLRNNLERFSQEGSQ